MIDRGGISEQEQKILLAYKKSAPWIQEAVRKLLDIPESKNKLVNFKDWIKNTDDTVG